ncbi:MAG: family 16 glycoside hydrolase [Planctomycetota bacterium]
MLTSTLLLLASTPIPFSAGAITCAGDTSAGDTITVLVVSGANNHDWEWTTPSIVQILEESDLFQVSTTYAPAEDLTHDATYEGLDAIVLDYNGARWGEAAEARFLSAVESGLGVVVVHAADNHGNGWPEYERLVGDLWRKGTGHGRFHPFNVDVTDRDHPVTRSLPNLVLHPDELYHRLVNVHGVERRVLASAFSDPETGGTGHHEPMILVKTYGAGRVFHTPLGHTWKGVPTSQASHRDPQFRGLLARGTQWAATGTVRDVETAPAPLTDEERADGWISLSDRGAWSSFGGGDVPKGWRFSGDTIRLEPGAGDIVTTALYEDFELTFDWKATIAGNSGVKYRIPQDAQRAVGPEFQLLDPSAKEGNAKHRMGALYGVVEAAEAPFTPWGEYRSARIVVRGERLEHYLDGELIAAANVGSDEWKAAVGASKFKNAAGFAEPKPGRILLQDHGDEVWIRGLRVRSLTPMSTSEAAVDEPADRSSEGAQPLLPASGSLDDWTYYGDALYSMDGDTLVGSAGPARKQSFLISKEVFGDFELNVDVQIEVNGNSGIQLRSHIFENGRFGGYQAEIDPTPRSWSAGIYDEGRRGWIDDLQDTPAARAAFDLEGWNHYRIVAEGPHIRTWVNGVPAANLLDGADLSGHFGWQVHGGDDDIQIRWRRPTIVRSGVHVWQDADPSDRVLNAIEFTPETKGLRFRVTGDDALVRFHHADGTLSGIVALADTKYWHVKGTNVVTALRDGARLVLQVNDRTLYDKETRLASAIEVTTTGAPIRCEGWSRCVKSGQ